VKKTKSPKPPKIISSWGLFLASLAQYRAHWKPYVKIMAAVAIPTNLISIFNLGSADAIAQSYISFASIVMNVAFIWAITRQEKSGRVPKLSAAYYDGSVALVRFLLLSFAILVMLIPAAFGLSLYGIAQTTADYFNTSGPELLLAGLAALVLSLPSLYMMVRYALSAPALVLEGLRPVASLRRGRLVTIGRFWPVAGRLAALAIFTAIIFLPSLLILFLLSLLKLGNLPTAIFQITATLTVLPFINIYMLRLFIALDEAPNAAEAEPSS
jgi:hypothetical protein